jgi:hypothetical protein
MAELDPDRATTLIMQAASPTPVRLRLVDGDRAWETIARWERTATGWNLIVDLPRVEILAVHLADLADPADRRGTDPDEDDTVISRRGAWREPGIIARD